MSQTQMHDKKRGELKNAPLIYVFAMIQIQEIKKYKELIADIQEELREKLPNYKETERTNNQIDFNPDGNFATSQSVSKQFYFSDINNKYGVMVKDDRIVLHSVDYVGFENFRERFEDIVATIKDVMRIKYYRGVGIRYIDNISRIGGLEIKDIVDNSLIPKNFENTNFGKNFVKGSSQGQIEYFNETNYGHLLFRSTYLKQQPPVPHNLYESYSILKEPKAVFDSLVLDTDHVMSDMKDLKEFDVSSAFDALDSLHNVCHDVFREMVDTNRLEEL